MRIAVAGARGQLGQDCLLVLGREHRVLGLDLPELDITRADSIRSAWGAFQADVILNCAAYTKVDACESDRDAAWRLNVLGPRLLAEYAHAHGARLVHISTDYVFDGRREPPMPYTEQDVPAPATYYGVTKLEGEKSVVASTGDAVILRTAWLYGVQGRNFLKAILSRALGNDSAPILVVNDQYGSPTWTHRLAVQIETVLGAPAGLYHATAEGYCTWCELARCFLDRMGLSREVVPCSTADYPTAAQRPANSILENARLEELGLNVMRPWEQDLGAFVGNFRQQLMSEASIEQRGEAWR